MCSDKANDQHRKPDEAQQRRNDDSPLLSGSLGGVDVVEGMAMFTDQAIAQLVKASGELIVAAQIERGTAGLVEYF